MASKEKLKKYWHSFTESPRAKKLQSLFRRLLLAVIVILIVYQLWDIGWIEVLHSLPTQPLFYVLFFVLYLTLPTVEVFIYRQVWKVKRWDSFKAFITKRVYNEEVMGYSGEFYLFMWARKRVNKSEKDVLKNVRDNNIISAVSSNLVAVVLISVLVYTGIVSLDDLFGNVNVVYIIAGVFIGIVLIALFIQFRKYIFSLPLNKALKVFLLYITRFIIHHGLLIVQWAIVIPDTPVSIWLLFIAIIIVVNRIPFIPSRDLVFMWAGIELSRALDMATASVAGMLLVTSAMKKSLNLILFLLISYFNKTEEIEELRKDYEKTIKEKQKD